MRWHLKGSVRGQDPVGKSRDWPWELAKPFACRLTEATYNSRHSDRVVWKASSAAHTGRLGEGESMCQLLNPDAIFALFTRMISRLARFAAHLFGFGSEAPFPDVSAPYPPNFASGFA